MTQLLQQGLELFEIGAKVYKILGLIEKVVKREGPARVMTLLGFEFNSTTGVLRIPEAKASEIVLLIRQVIATAHKGGSVPWSILAQSSLLNDVPHLVHAFEANPSVFITRKSAPKRASTAVRDATLPPPPLAFPNDPLNPRPIKSVVVLKKKNSVGIVGTRRTTLRSGVKDMGNNI